MATTPEAACLRRWVANRPRYVCVFAQLEALYSLLDDDGSGSLTVHEMIDLFVSPAQRFSRSAATTLTDWRFCLQDGINNDALLIDDCNGNPAPHHWCASKRGRSVCS